MAADTGGKDKVTNHRFYHDKELGPFPKRPDVMLENFKQNSNCWQAQAWSHEDSYKNKHEMKSELTKVVAIGRRREVTERGRVGGASRKQ